MKSSSKKSFLNFADGAWWGNRKHFRVIKIEALASTRAVFLEEKCNYMPQKNCGARWKIDIAMNDLRRLFSGTAEREKVLKDRKVNLFITIFQRKKTSGKTLNCDNEAANFYGPFVRSCVKLEFLPSPSFVMRHHETWFKFWRFPFQFIRVIESKSYDNLHKILFQNSWRRFIPGWNLLVFCWRLGEKIFKVTSDFLTFQWVSTPLPG